MHAWESFWGQFKDAEWHSLFGPAIKRCCWRSAHVTQQTPNHIHHVQGNIVHVSYNLFDTDGAAADHLWQECQEGELCCRNCVVLHINTFQQLSGIYQRSLDHGHCLKRIHAGPVKHIPAPERLYRACSVAFLCLHLACGKAVTNQRDVWPSENTS